MEPRLGRMFHSWATGRRLRPLSRKVPPVSSSRGLKIPRKSTGFAVAKSEHTFYH